MRRIRSPLWIGITGQGLWFYFSRLDILLNVITILLWCFYRAYINVYMYSLARIDWKSSGKSFYIIIIILRSVRVYCTAAADHRTRLNIIIATKINVIPEKPQFPIFYNTIRTTRGPISFNDFLASFVLLYKTTQKHHFFFK